MSTDFGLNALDIGRRQLQLNPGTLEKACRFLLRVGLQVRVSLRLCFDLPGSKGSVFTCRVIAWPSRVMTTGAISTQAGCGRVREASFAIWSKSLNFSIKAAIRALVAPDHRINCRTSLWRTIVAELRKRGHGQHESGAFLLGTEAGKRMNITDVVFYDDLDPDAYASGICVLHGDAFAKLWQLCRERRKTIVADIHTHPGTAFQSPSDIANPMVAQPGHIAIIVPYFAASPVHAEHLGIYEYRGRHQWINRTYPMTHHFLYTGFWS
ncbi:MAG: hypothetical protein AB7G28_02315 [Pirellulales bacterium]